MPGKSQKNDGGKGVTGRCDYIQQFATNLMHRMR